MRLTVLPDGYESWTFDGGFGIARAEVRATVAEAVARHGTLYRWAEGAAGREEFRGRGAAYGVELGGRRAVVRHARRGGVPGVLLDDWFLGSPRFINEILISGVLAAAGIPTPEVLAGVAYAAGLGYRADVATARIEGRDLARVFFSGKPPSRETRIAILRAAARLVRGLHDAGYDHPDLQLKNILVSDGPTAWLLDVDTCRRSARPGLDRFFRSWDKWNSREGERLSPEDRAAFEAAYRAGER